VGDGKRRKIENFLEQNNAVWRKFRWNPTCNFEKNNNNFFFMDLQIHLYFRFFFGETYESFLFVSPFI